MAQSCQKKRGRLEKEGHFLPPSPFVAQEKKKRGTKTLLFGKFGPFRIFFTVGRLTSTTVIRLPVSEPQIDLETVT